MAIAEGTVVAGRYRIVRELGRGGMGSVYLAEHVNTGGHWALKVMHGSDHLGADRAARFRREARASSRITSENVVRVTDADVAAELDGAPFIVMELLDGEDLDHLLTARPSLSPKETVDILLQVARGLDKAHAAGVVHRDLKPENIFLHRRDDGSTVAKVVDFGISKVLRPEDDPSLMSVTSSGEIMGTPLYMSPEQARGRAEDIGPGTDVWAIGLMAYRMLAGANFWEADTIANLFFQILTDDKPKPSSKCPGLGDAFDAWFAKSCAITPADRYKSVGEQVAELSQALLGQRVMPAGPTPQYLTAPNLPLGSDVTQRAETPAHLSVSDHSVPATDVSLPTSAGISRSVGQPPKRASKAMFVGAGAAVLLVIAGISAMRAKSHASEGESSVGISPKGAESVTSSAPSASGSSVASAAVASGGPSLVPMPSASDVASAPVAAPASAFASTAPSPSAPAKPGSPTVTAPHPKASASAPPKTPSKPADLFDTQK